MHKLSSLLKEETTTPYWKPNNEFLTFLSRGNLAFLVISLYEQSMNLIL